MSPEERRAKREHEWATLHAALGRTRDVVDRAQRQKAPWAALREQQRAHIRPLLLAWHQQMDGLQRPLSLWRLHYRRLGLLVAYGLPDLRPIAVWTRLRLVALAVLIILTWLWQRRRIILRVAALAVALALAFWAFFWLIDKLPILVNAIRGALQ